MEVQIEKWVYGGCGLARHNGRVVLVPYVLPGERVEIEVVREKPGLIEGRCLRRVEESSERAPAPCPAFEKCGGCHYQHAPAEFQVARKVEILREALRRVGKLDAPEEIGVRTGEPWGYRNRSQFHLDREGRIGMLAWASNDLVPLESCPIAAPAINEALAALREMAKDRRWPRFVREIELFTNGERTMLNVLSTEGGRGVAGQFFEWAGEKIRGANEGSLDYEAAGETLRVSHGSFFQVNRFLTGDLVACALEGAEGESALDLYSGAGLFSLPLARRFKQVDAVETDSSAVRDLEHNAGRAGLKVTAHRLQSEQYLEGLEAAPDFVLADPPRSGLGKHVVKHLARLKPAKMTIVSCDPATLARDLAGLLGAGYRIESMTLVDLFPQTFHVETVTRLAQG
jgi:23S rRNA (uracil1939-C5)-methyltransferase